MQMKPFLAVQALGRGNPTNGKIDIVGSSFRLWSSNHFITAQHCVRNIEPSQLKIMNPLSDTHHFNCLAINRHAKADIAVLEVQGTIPEQLEKFKLSNKEASYGANIHCFGIMINLLETGAPARVIGGIIQRDFTYKDGTYQSAALELSVPIPKGMSGGPAFFAHRDDIAIGVAIASIKSEVVVSEFEEYENDKLKEKERISEITRYGVILNLWEVKSWLEEVIPKKD